LVVVLCVKSIAKLKKKSVIRNVGGDFRRFVSPSAAVRLPSSHEPFCNRLKTNALRTALQKVAF
jgi:hypothetical protein